MSRFIEMSHQIRVWRSARFWKKREKEVRIMMLFESLDVSLAIAVILKCQRAIEVKTCALHTKFEAPWGNTHSLKISENLTSDQLW